MKYSELIRILKQNGWFVVRQSGSHVMMQHPDKPIQLTVPNHGSKEIGKGLQQKILKQAGIKK
jgi:predicted RNA binding protein YcfA (HicA-like mRNA interferase family)